MIRPLLRTSTDNDRNSREVLLMIVDHEMNRRYPCRHDHIRLVIAVLVQVPISNLLLRDRILKQVRFHVLDIQINVIGGLPL